MDSSLPIVTESCKPGYISIKANTLQQVENKKIKHNKTGNEKLLSFPATRAILWDRRPVGSSCILHISQYKNPALVLEEKTLRLAHRFTQESSSESYKCFFLASTSLNTDCDGLQVSVDRFEADSRLSEAELYSECNLVIPCLIKKNSAKPKSSFDDFKGAIKKICERCRSKSKLSISDFLCVNAYCSYHENKQHFIFHLDFTFITSGVKVKLTPINAVPVVLTALSKNLAAPVSGLQGEPKSGYLTMDQTRKVLLVLESDPKVSSLPLVGIWINGVRNMEDPFVWICCLRYLFNSALEERVVMPPESFLVIIYSQVHSKPDFYECVTVDGNCSMKLHLGTCHEVIQLSKNHLGRAESPLELEFVAPQQGEKRELFEQALQESQTLIEDCSNCQSSTKTISSEDITPRSIPKPYLSSTHSVQSLVPEVSVILEEKESHVTPRLVPFPQQITRVTPPQYLGASNVKGTNKQSLKSSKKNTPNSKNDTLSQNVITSSATQFFPAQVASPLLQGNGFVPGPHMSPQYYNQPKMLSNPAVIEQSSNQPLNSFPYFLPNIVNSPPHHMQIYNNQLKTSHPYGPYSFNGLVYPNNYQVYPMVPVEGHFAQASPQVYQVQRNMPFNNQIIGNNNLNNSLPINNVNQTGSKCNGEVSNSLTRTMQSNPITHSATPSHEMPSLDLNEHNMPSDLIQKTGESPEQKQNRNDSENVLKNGKCPQRQNVSPQCDKNQGRYGDISNQKSSSTDSGLQVSDTADTTTDSMKTGITVLNNSPTNNAHHQRSQEVPVNVYELIKDQETQLKFLREQLSQLLSKQQENNMESTQLKHVTNVDDSKLVVCDSKDPPPSLQSLATATQKQMVDMATQMSAHNTPLKPKKSLATKSELNNSTSSHTNSSINTSRNKIFEVKKNIQHVADNKISSESLISQNCSSYKSNPDGKIGTPCNNLEENRRDDGTNVSNLDSVSFNDLQMVNAWQHHMEESLVSEMMVDMPAFSSLSPDKQNVSQLTDDSSCRSPMLGESVSMYERLNMAASQADQPENEDSRPDVNLYYQDQKQFYQNLRGNVQKFLCKNLSEDQAVNPYEENTDAKEIDQQLPHPENNKSRISVSNNRLENLKVEENIAESKDNVALRTLQQLQSMGVEFNSKDEKTETNHTAFFDSLMLPKISYVSMMLENESENCEADDLAMKYLSDEQLTELAKIRSQNHVDASGKNINLTTVSGQCDVKQSSETFYGLPFNHMSFASKKYLERYGLLNSNSSEKSEKMHKETRTLNKENKHESPVLTHMFKNSEMRCVSDVVKQLKEKSFVESPTRPEEPYNISLAAANYVNENNCNGEEVIDSTGEISKPFHLTKRTAQETEVSKLKKSDPNVVENILDIERLRELPKLL